MTQVVINDIAPYTQAVAILNQTVFSTDWTANYASDVVVYLTPFGNTPDDVTQILNSSLYTIAFIGSELIVQVTLVNPAAAGDLITITRQTPADRENLYTNTNFTPSMLNNDFGILTLVDQQNQLVNQRIAPRYNYSALIDDPIDLILPILPPNECWVMNDDHTQIITMTPLTTEALGDVKFIVQQPNALVPDAQALSVLPTGILKSTTTTGVLTISAPLTSLDSAGINTNEYPYGSGPDTYTLGIITPFSRSLLEEADAAAWRAALGAGTGDGTVTEVDTGTGLTGGPITSTGTISFADIIDFGILSNISGGNAAPVPNVLTDILDYSVGSSQGDILYRNASDWVVLSAGTNGYFLKTQGPSADPIWDSTPPSGVTEIDTADGIAGGPITTSGTIVLADIPDLNLLANISGGVLFPSPHTLTAIIDACIGSTQGDILYRNNTGWVVLAPGTDGYFLRTHGAADNPTWDNVPISGGTVTSVATNNGLTGGTITTTGTLGLDDIADNTLLANISGGVLFPSSTTVTALIDSAISNTQGSILYRDASAWVALAPGTNGYFLKTQGAAADPVWALGGSGSSPWFPGAGTESAYGGGATDGLADGTLVWGLNALASNNGSFVFSDRAGSPATDALANQFVQTFSGGFSYYLTNSVLAASIDNIGNLTNNQGTADASYSLQTPIDGDSIAIASGFRTLLLDPATDLATLTLTMPGSPVQGQELRFSSTKLISALTLLPNIGQSISNPSIGLSPGQGVMYEYDSTSNNWYPVYGADLSPATMISSVIPYGSPVSLTNNLTADITSITLPPGIWNVYGNIFFAGSGLNVTGVTCWSSETSATSPDPSLFNALGNNLTLTNDEMAFSIPFAQYTVTTPTVIYLSGAAAFASGTVVACGGIYAVPAVTSASGGGSGPWTFGTGILSGKGGDPTVTAAGDYSLAYGNNSTAANDEYSFAFGNACTTTAPYSFAFGNACNVINTGSVVWGDSNVGVVNDSYQDQFNLSFVNGFRFIGNTLFFGSVGFGSGPTGLYAATFGLSNGAGGDYAFVTGNECTAGSSFSEAHGYQCVGNGTHSYARGNAAITNNNGSVVWGDSNAAPITDTLADQFNLSFAGGYNFYLNNSPTLAVSIDAYGALINHQGVADQSYNYQTPSSGDTITCAFNSESLLLQPAGTLALLNINFPPAYTDGQIFQVSSTQEITSLSLAPYGGDTIQNAPMSLAAGQGFAFKYQLANTQWLPSYQPSAGGGSGVSISPYIVAPGGYTTIQSAIDAAVLATPSATNILEVIVTPGQYTEDLVLASFVTLSLAGGSDIGAVNVIGSAQYTPANPGDIFTSNGITYTNVSGGCFYINGTDACTVYLNGNIFNCTSGYGIIGGNPSGNIISTNDKIFAASGCSAYTLSGNATFLNSYIITIDTASSVTSATIKIIGGYHNNNINLGSSGAIIEVDSSYIVANAYSGEPFIIGSGNTVNICNSNVIANYGTYWVSGNGNLNYGNVIVGLGSAIAIDPGLTSVNLSSSSSPFNFGAGSGSAIGGDGSATAVGNYAIAYGDAGTSAVGNNSFAFGTGTTSVGIYSFAFGLSALAFADYAFAFGDSAFAFSINSMAIGPNTQTSGVGSVVWGDSTAFPVADTADNQFNMTFANGFRFFLNNSPTMPFEIDPSGNINLTGPIRGVTEIQDAAGAPMLHFNYLGTTDNYFEMTNATSAAPTINLAAIGSSTSVRMQFSSKGGGGFVFADTTSAATIYMFDAANSYAVTLSAPASLGANVNFTLPAMDGAADNVLVTDGSGVLSFQTPIAFSAWNSTPTTLAASGFTKVELQSLNFNIGTAFDNVTNYRFLAPRDGVYHFDAQVWISSANVTSGVQYNLALYVNGSVYAYGSEGTIAVATNTNSNISVDIELVLGDYVELFFLNANAATTIATNASQLVTWMTGHYVCAPG